MTTPATRPTNRREEFVRLAPWMILFAYTVWIIIILPEHEPWTDEAQAWLLARDASLPDLLWKYLRYAGTPGLWNVLLAIPAKLGLPYFTLNITGALSALAGVFLLVRFSPFPLWLKALLPFTYFLAYQYAVVARSYCLLAPLLFATAIFRRQRSTRYWPFALTLGLLSHVSFHGTLMAGAIWLGEVWALSREIHPRSSPEFRTRIVCLIALLTNFLIVAAQVSPPPDGAILPPQISFAASTQLALVAISESLTGIAWLSVVLLAAILPFLQERRVLPVFGIGFLLLIALFGFRYFALWHAGTITVFLIYACWVALNGEPLRDGDFEGRREPWRIRLALASLAIICAFQIRDTAMAGLHDFSAPYSASREAAAYLRERGINARRINALDMRSFAVLPYFEKNIFANYNRRLPGAFWIESLTNEQLFSVEGMTEGYPDYILFAWNQKTRPLGAAILPRYEIEQIFAGDIFWKSRILETNNLVLFRRRMEVTPP